MTTSTGTPIVVGVDGSPPAAAAVDWAVAEAVRRGVPLHLVHVVEREPHDLVPPDAAAQIVAAALARAHAAAPGLDVTAGRVEGHAAAALVEQSAVACLLVVGNRGLGGFASLLAGSVSVQTAAHAHCPVVVVRPQSSGASGVVVGVDGSERSEAAVAFAFAEAARRGVGLTAVRAWHPPVSTSPGELTYAVVERVDLADLEIDLLAKALAHHRDRYPQVPVHQAVDIGNAGAVLADASRDAELVVVGSRGHGGFAGLLLGSVSDALVRHAGCPVAVVHATREPS
jgi:nucleotide-binding universal stress UspA family protein